MKATYWKIDRLPGMSQLQCTLLKACGVYTTKDLLEKTQTPQHKQALANQLKLNIQYVNKFYGQEV